ncbi:UDP-glucose 4-epimerase GalE [Pseudomonas resinovorans]|uniref:UDP-glucose 4-epimerase GalE n=1 Tax=Metapseudomonas resinovorans TaxID=53412 RepID=UPI00237EFEBD|nr:UDP-glucose 4-epimerase GalE [Pseudomonas resinovorans]MDE3740027.1 UDP-glucose 4-epimerase GalE [Pseudomonas resinovorans]
MRVLVTGGAGFIGSHVLVDLVRQGAHVVVLDNLKNSSVKSVLRVERITGASIRLVVGDVRDQSLIENLLLGEEIDSVIHLAGLKAVGESCEIPLGYYENNVQAAVSLLRAMENCQVFNLVFSSSATVYRMPTPLPLSEDSRVGRCSSPYGRSKLMVESMLRDLSHADRRWSVALLRYFNPIGAHESGLIGDDPNGIPDNLLPFVAQVAIGRLGKLVIHGGDYPTADGTGVRDYVHVCDLASGHVKALDYLERHTGCHTWNLGTGIGYSVLEVVAAFERVSGKRIPYEISARRSGDVAACWADVSKANRELGWKAVRGLDCMVADAWRWQSKNPSGYA